MAAHREGRRRAQGKEGKKGTEKEGGYTQDQWSLHSKRGEGTSVNVANDKRKAAFASKLRKIPIIYNAEILHENIQVIFYDEGIG